MKLRRILSLILIVAGFGVAAYPIAERGYTWYRQQKILQEIRAQQEAELFAAYKGYLSANNKGSASGGGVVTDISQAAETVSLGEAVKEGVDVLGVIKIEKIAMKLPVLQGIGFTSLKVGAGHIPGTAWVGEIGNIALAGHNSKTKGRFFNRLKELEVGDKVRLETDKNNFDYTVTRKFYVSERDLSPLNTDGKTKMLTLITCKQDDNTQRLILQAVQVE